MSKKSLIFIGLLGLIIIFFLCGLKHYRAMEQDVADCSNSILKQVNLTGLKVDTKNLGLDGIISGIVKKESHRKNALSLLQGKCHLAHLTDKVTVTPTKPTIQPNLSLKINSASKMASMTGRTADTDEIKGIISTFTKNMGNIKLDTNIINNDEIFPSNFQQDLSIILPKLKFVKNPEVLIANKKLTLKGIVTTHAIKNNIGKVLRLRFRNKLKINNLLTVVPVKIAQTAPTKAVKKQLANVKSCQTKLTEILSKSMIHFNSSSAVIKPDSFVLLNKLVNIAKSCQGVKIGVIGHTDKSGNEAFNIKLSKNRATSVIAYLVKSGVQVNKLSATGVGSSQPIATNETVIGRSKNRRIQFKVNSL